LAVPENADLIDCILKAQISPWLKASGGLGEEFKWTTRVQIVDEMTPKKPGRGAGKKDGTQGAGSGNLVALVWKNDADEDEWNATTVGEIAMVSGAVLAETRPEYKELAKVKEEIPTIMLNGTYSKLKNYLQARAAELTEEGRSQAQERYAVGVGVALLVLHEKEVKAKKSGMSIDEEVLRVSRDAAARAVLSVMPEYDRLAKEMDS
jgi:hypothetical protein